eukprot:TRINITY_DN9530_c0_g1_i1.p1 TRINITY_DN9530_c0_g1~~TRINITY_DN9530_c0_g1_i1.p1  ORF type:complete len:635 (+),score=161.64 TRINITY_DN9530_c0_g1_i1:86-1990(+)
MGLETALFAAAFAAGRAPRPHILFVVADDLGWNDVGYHQNAASGANPQGRPTTSAAGGVMRTPTIDRLSSEGVRLESYYVQPLCSPSRATFMTGRYPFHTGLGPDVVCTSCGQPYGLAARETLLPELLRGAGYATHAVGKWHLGACDERYLPTARGFDSFIGYLAGAESYYSHRADMRNGTAGSLPQCVGAALDGYYSASLYSSEAARIVHAHAAQSSGIPLFLYLAFQNVHNPYDVPPPSVVDVNASYPEIAEYGRRVYAGMVFALDLALGNVTAAFQSAGLWDDTVLVFTTDNGGVEWGNNYPLRGMKVYTWEGGIRGVAFVRGTNSERAPLPAGAVRGQLMHSTDWLPTLCGLAGAAASPTLPLDGVDQWPAISAGGPALRDLIVHNLPARAAPQRGADGRWTTTTCMGHIDPALGRCNPFGSIGGALRKGHWKLLWAGDVQGVESNVPLGMKQLPPRGWTPPAGDSVPAPFNGTLFLFNISADPTESHNLAAQEPAVLAELLQLREQLTADPATIGGVGWRFSFKDTSGHKEGGCEGPILDSAFCAYGREFECWVQQRGIAPAPGDERTAAAGELECAQACAARGRACEWWSLNASATAGARCLLCAGSAAGRVAPCPGCAYGPRECPGA